MSRQASSDYADHIPGRATTSPKEEDRPPCLFVAGHAAFQRKAVWTRLEASGNRVCRFTGPAALLAAIESTSPDVIFCEVNAVPEPTFELLNRLAAVQSDACVILMGPDLGAEQVARCLRDGAFDYLTVPAPTTRVLDSLQKGLINRQAFQAVRDLSGQLAQVNASLAGERDVLRQWNSKLSLLNHLTQALAGPLNSESIARSLFNGLAGLVPVDVIGLGRPDPHRVWTWSRTAAYEAQEQRVRAHLLSRFNALAAPVSQAHAEVRRWSSGLPETERPAQMTIPLTFSPNSQGLLYVERQQGEQLAHSPLLPWMMKVDWLLEVIVKTLAQMHPGGVPIAQIADVNLSGGGIGFNSPRSFAAEDKLSIKVVLPPFTPIDATARVIRSIPLKEGLGYSIATEFVSLSPTDQEHLIRHILQTQAERLRARRNHTS